MERVVFSKLLAVDVPLPICNLKCHYCYISLQNGWIKNHKIEYDVGLISKAFAPSRFGGVCLINLTGTGETLLPNNMPDIIEALLKHGHYLEVVTNGTLSKRFEAISRIDKNLLKHLEFKFSFHYLELKRLHLMDSFISNVKLMKDSGCSFTIELMPNDELVEYIDDVKKICYENFGALCQLTIGRDDNNNRRILTKFSNEDYCKIWSQFDSTMFKFKYDIFDVKRKEFCYAGKWSLYINLANGDASQCYGYPPNQNIYKNVNKRIIFRPVGKHCKQPYCYNGHAFLSLGLIPNLTTPSYRDIRNRKCLDGTEWFNSECSEAFSTKLCDSNKECSKCGMFFNEITRPFNFCRMVLVNRKRIAKKLFEKKKKNG